MFRGKNKPDHGKPIGFKLKCHPQILVSSQKNAADISASINRRFTYENSREAQAELSHAHFTVCLL